MVVGLKRFHRVVSLKKHFASEKRTLDWCIEQYPDREKQAINLINKINYKFKIDKGSKILEIGAAQGLLTIAFNKLGYKCEGIEPYEEAVKLSEKLSNILNTNLNVKKGFAENITFENDSFDAVIADSVIEHVKDVKKVFDEVYRVLKPNGCFYFYTASSLCPIQNEIRFFPFFSWYPDNIKIKIIKWAIKNEPSLVGYTNTPAINWFTPLKANKLLKEAGFKEIYDRWDFLIEDEISKDSRKLSVRLIKFFKDVMTPDCAYLAIKK